MPWVGGSEVSVQKGSHATFTCEGVPTTENPSPVSDSTLAVAPEQELLPAQEVADQVIDQVAQDIR